MEARIKSSVNGERCSREGCGYFLCIMIRWNNKTKAPIYRIKTCKYCLDYKGQPKPILPEDLPSAIRMPDGS
jgi:hypothetical protein